MKPVLSVATLILMIVAAVNAHDPLEITATAFSREDGLEVKLELEWATARLLTGAERVTARETDLNAAFHAAQPALKRAAGDFLRVHADGDLLPVVHAEAGLASEDHVHFVAMFPPVVGKALRFDAPGLARLPVAERYGVSLTAVDMVNKRVLGQAVLYADAAEAEFAAVAPGSNLTVSGHKPEISASIATGVETASTPVVKESPPASRRGLWWWIPFAIMMPAGFAWWRHRNAPTGTRHD